MHPKKKVKVNQDIKPVVNEDDDQNQGNGHQQQVEEVKIEKVEDGKSQAQRNKEIEIDAFGFEVQKAKNWYNKQRVLILASRGINALGRHLMLDLHALLPHSKKDVKVEKEQIADQINELCQLNSCNNVLFFECRKKRDVYLWMGKAPNGPSVKFHVENMHTTDELKMTGNCIKGSRPLLSFDASFDETPVYKLFKEMFIHVFGTPNHHPKSKPFYDHVLSFCICENRVWFRNYQIIYNSEEKDLNDIELVEIGPRFVLNPIRVFEGLMHGMVIYDNQFFVNPNIARRADKLKKDLEKAKKIGVKKKRKQERHNLVIPGDEIDNIFDEDGLGNLDNDDDYEDYEDDE